MKASQALTTGASSTQTGPCVARVKLSLLSTLTQVRSNPKCFSVKKKKCLVCQEASHLMPH